MYLVVFESVQYSLSLELLPKTLLQVQHIVQLPSTNVPTITAISAHFLDKHGILYMVSARDRDHDHCGMILRTEQRTLAFQLKIFRTLLGHSTCWPQEPLSDRDIASIDRHGMPYKVPLQ